MWPAIDKWNGPCFRYFFWWVSRSNRYDPYFVFPFVGCKGTKNFCNLQIFCPQIYYLSTDLFLSTDFHRWIILLDYHRFLFIHRVFLLSTDYLRLTQIFLISKDILIITDFFLARKSTAFFKKRHGLAPHWYPTALRDYGLLAQVHGLVCFVGGSQLSLPSTRPMRSQPCLYFSIALMQIKPFPLRSQPCLF